MPIATLGVAWNRRRPEGEDEVSFFNVVCFRQLAENVAESLHKGARVVVYGTLQQRRWDSADGEQRAVVEIIAEDVAPSLLWATAEVHKNEYRGGPPDGGDGGYRTERSKSVRSPAWSARADSASVSAEGSRSDVIRRRRHWKLTRWLDVFRLFKPVPQNSSALK